MAGPFIDPSIMLLDPQLTDRFAVVKRIQSVSSGGIVSITETIRNNVLGVVTPAKPGDLKRHDDRQYGNRNIVIFTRYLLNDAARTIWGTPQQRQPDHILWSYDKFVVLEVLPWGRYGPGWVRAVASSIDSIESVVVDNA